MKFRTGDNVILTTMCKDSKNHASMGSSGIIKAGPYKGQSPYNYTNFYVVTIRNQEVSVWQENMKLLNDNWNEETL